jgi:exodeoxyribonuclease VII large subunit
VDISLAELAADQRASTPSNAAQLLVPDRLDEARRLASAQRQLGQLLAAINRRALQDIQTKAKQLGQSIKTIIADERQRLQNHISLLAALSPKAVLGRGYAILRSNGAVVRSGSQLKAGQDFMAQLSDADLLAQVKKVSMK